MLPVETALALFPAKGRTLRVGRFRRLTLRPLTLERAAAMEMVGCGILSGRLTAPQSLLAAWVLSARDGDVARIALGDMRGGARFVRRLSRHVRLVEYAVNVFMGEATLPFVPPKAQEGEFRVDDGLPRGNGWPLEVAEALCAHYGWAFDDVMKIAVPRAFALLATSRNRTGVESGGPDYYDRIRLERWRASGVIPAGKEA